jgi:type I restriction enzyme S subunit
MKGLPIIRIQNLNGSASFNYFDGDPEPAWLVEPGDLLFAWAGVKGVSFGPTIWNGPRGVLNQHIYRIRPKNGINKRWLYYALLEVTAEIEGKAHGFKKSLVHVRKADITRARISLPSEQEQEAVAKALWCWDTAIQKTEQLIAAKEQHYSHELSRLISRGQHPQCSPAPAKAGVGAFAEEVSARTRGGRPALLGDFLTESREPDTEQDPAKRLTVRLHLQGVEPRPVRGTESDGATAYFRRRAGQLIYGKQNIFRGAIGIIPPELDGYASTQDLPAFDIADGIDPQWLYFWLSRKGFYASLEALAAGSGSKRLHPEEFSKVRIFVPDLATQTAIARYLNALREEIDLLGQSVAALKTQKRGLMQKLLTGQWRLPVQEEAN